MPGAPAPVVILAKWAWNASPTYTTSPIPAASQQPNPRASYADGFPPQTVGATGTPPDVRDFNGVLEDVTSNIVAFYAGQFAQFNAAVAAQNGGYALGAIVVSADGTGYWVNQVSGNSNNPDTGGGSSGWVPLDQYGITPITGLTNANVTLTAPQAGKPIITLAGALTANVQIILPPWKVQWQVANNTTGAFSVTCKTALGAGIIVPQGVTTTIYGDGTNIDLVGSSLSANTGAVANTLALRDSGAGLTASSFNVSSDSTLKLSISPLEGDHLARLDLFRGVTYRLKATGELRAGLIAQDFQKARPEGVKLGKEGYLTIDPMAVIAELTEMLRAERDARRALESRVARLEKRR